MLTLGRYTCFTLCSVSLLYACGKTDQQSAESATPEAAGFAAADVAGRWNMRAVPFSGDTTPTTFILTATADNNGWTLTFPDRPVVPTRVRIEGDSIVSEAGPYASVRRKGVQVRTNTVLRLQGDSLVGTAVARYTTAGADTVLNLRVSGTRAR
jgi:hypothetical protein